MLNHVASELLLLGISHTVSESLKGLKGFRVGSRLPGFRGSGRRG